jgi:hypothetical protein
MLDFSFAAGHNALALDRIIRVEKCVHLLWVVYEHRRSESEERNNQQRQGYDKNLHVH